VTCEGDSNTWKFDLVDTRHASNQGRREEKAVDADLGGETPTGETCRIKRGRGNLGMVRPALAYP
jgi:hypothetical protein